MDYVELTSGGRSLVKRQVLKALTAAIVGLKQNRMTLEENNLNENHS